MSKIWVVSYNKKDGVFSVEVDRKSFELFPRQYDEISMDYGYDSVVVRGKNIDFPILKGIYVATESPEVWEDVMSETFIHEEQQLREEIGLSIGVVEKGW